MLDLRDSRWKKLSDAYGSAGHIPELLAQLRTARLGLNYSAEPWSSRWSSLCHQGDVYTASYAAMPHIIKIGSIRAIRDRLDFVLMSDLLS